MPGTQIVAIITASLAQFFVGAIWYMPLFGNLWGKIHCFDKVDKKKQKEMQAKMMPLLGVQFFATIITTVVLVKLVTLLPSYSPYMLGVMSWLGFVVPTQVSAVLFGGTEPKWIVTKILIMAGGSLACFLVGVAILSFFL